MYKAKTWQQAQDEKLIRENEMKRNAEEAKKDPLVENLKKEGNIKEAAAVFSYEGFQFLINTIGDIVVKKVEPIIDQKFKEIFQGMQEGLAKAVSEIGQTKIENVLSEKVENFNFGTSEEVKQMEEQPEDDIQLDNNQYSNSDVSHYNGIALEFAAPTIEEKVEEKEEEYEIYSTTYTGYDIPRLGSRGIHWSSLDQEHQRQIFLFYIGLADEKDSLTTTKFKKFHPDANGIYQRILRNFGRGGWEKLIEEYNEKYTLVKAGK